MESVICDWIIPAIITVGIALISLSLISENMAIREAQQSSKQSRKENSRQRENQNSQQ